jgi:hypothetical protein
VIALTWVDNSSNESEFHIEESVSSGAFSELGTAPANNTAANIINRVGGTTYSYRVRAHNSAGHSSYSNVATVTTLPSQLIAYASAANALGVLFVNGVNDNTEDHTVYQFGKIAVGCNVIIGATSAASCYSSALQFSNFGSLVAGRTITSAYLRLSASDLAGDFNAVYGASAFAGSWSPATITYFNQPSHYVSPETLHAPPNASNTIIDFDVTSLVQLWANGTRVNNGILVQPTSTAPGAVVETTFFWSDDSYNGVPAWRPQLIINVQ